MIFQETILSNSFSQQSHGLPKHVIFFSFFSFPFFSFLSCLVLSFRFFSFFFLFFFLFCYLFIIIIIFFFGGGGVFCVWCAKNRRSKSSRVTSPLLCRNDDPIVFQPTSCGDSFHFILVKVIFAAMKQLKQLQRKPRKKIWGLNVS